MKNKRLLINLIASILAFVIQMGINFIITPIIVEKIGNEAYGFIGLANNFISYATILTVALNSMAGRFISVSIHRGENEKANKYYSSIFIADTIISILILIVSSAMIWNLEKIIKIPEKLESDVKITFMLTFINFAISLIATVFNVATFVKNRIDLSSIQNIIGNVIKVLVILALFIIFKPKIYYIIISTIIYTIYISIANYNISKKITPELTVSNKYFDWKSIKEIIKSGIWNSVNGLSRVLLTGLDLLISNILIDPLAMGILSVAKTIPTAIETLLSTIGNVFTPHFTILYSNNKKEELVKEVNYSIRIMSLLMIVPIAGFIIFGTEFYTLWLPSKTIDEIKEIQILSILSLLPHIFSCCIYTLYSIDVVTNRLKRTVLVTLGMSIVSTLVVILLLNTTNLGIYAVAGVSSFIWLLKVLFFTPMNAAYNLKVKLTTFYPPFLRAIGCLGIVLILFYELHKLFNIHAWIDLIIVASIVGTLGYIIVFSLILKREEKKKIINKVLIKCHIGGKYEND